MEKKKKKERKGKKDRKALKYTKVFSLYAYILNILLWNDLIPLCANHLNV